MINDHNVADAPIDGLVRLARWLGLTEPDGRETETEAQHRWRIGRAIQREEKRLERLPRSRRNLVRP